MDVPDEGPLDVDLLADDGSDDDGEAPPSSDFYPGPASTPTSCASSPRGEEPASPHGLLGQPNFFHQPPYTRPFFVPFSRRGPGRPRKEGIKLTREGKIVKRYKNPGSVRGAKRSRGSRDGDMEECLDEDDFTVPLSEEPPYFPEKWPGKVCALCNLGERSQLGQGEMRQIQCDVGDSDGSTTPTVPSGAATPSNAATPTSTPSTPVPPGIQSPPPELLDPTLNPLAIPLSRKQRASGKCRTPVYNLEHTDELSIIGHIEPLELIAVVSNRALYVHRSCLDFSPQVQDETAAPTNEEDGETIEESRVRGIVTAALLRKCAFCQRHGASIPCKISCSKYFHFPCVLASGGFIDFQTKSSFCKDHLYQVPLLCTSDVDCRTCHVVGDISNLMTCVTCGAHYHGTCVGLAQLPGVRSGWSCRTCRVCQVCRVEAPGESRAVSCEHCDKLYHATCLRPVMATVPKYGWKCKCCRVCSDCGARSPGAGPSSRWHAHYTVCDSCYQQRNKGSCCPLCRRAYRAAAMRDMIRCALCKRYVHSTCDPEADPQQYRSKKEQNQGYEYNCPICKTQMQLTGNTSKTSSFDEDTMVSTSQDSSFADENSQEQDPLAIETKPDVGLGKGKPYTVSSKVAKKKLSGFKLKGKYPPAGKQGFMKRQRLSVDFGRKRGSKPKMRGVFGVPGLGLQRPQAPDNKTSDDDPGVENKLVLCSSKDKFVLTQDLCVMCGAIGTDSEGCLIACAQCGQTYHPYCVNIKVSHAIVVLGWRCLDCTVCEGCGSRGDEALLVLCDECDTAWHTYCARPTLAEVPRGSWRCDRCRRCRVCGTTDVHVQENHYTECGPCASLTMCSVCSEPYCDGELIIQCEPCRRWLHATCDGIRTENDAETCCKAGYLCVSCRGGGVGPPHAAPPPPSPPPAPSPRALGLQGEYYVDDVCLSHRGATHMKLLEAEMGLTTQRRKRRFKNEHQDTAVVQNADGEGHEESKPDSTAEVKEEPGVHLNVKEGCMWNVSVDGPPPEGFAIYTAETGITVLRRKRQRNLNKLGIGGFVVRQRSNTKHQPDDDHDGTQESPGNKRKPRRKPRSKLMEQFPPYMQEAFFGKELMEPSAKPVVSSTAGTSLESPGNPLRASTPEGYRELRDFNFDPDNSDSDADDVVLTFSTYNDSDPTCVISLNPDEAELLQSIKPKKEKEDSNQEHQIKTELLDDSQLKHTEDSTALKNAILGPQAAEVDSMPNTDAIPTVHMNKTEKNSNDPTGRQPPILAKDELLCGVNIDAMVRDTLPDMDSNLDVDEIFKGVLTDDSQESQESSVSYVNPMATTPYPQQRQQLQSPMEYQSPYHTDFSSGRSSLSPGHGPGYSETGWADPPAPPPHSTYNQRSADKMRADESLGSAATISAVLYANTNHPEWKTEFPNWVDRCKQILKKWRALPADQKAPYLQRARDNRSAIRMKKAQQTSGAASPGVTSPGAVGGAVGGVASGAVGVVGGVASDTVRAPNVTVTPEGVLEADAHIRVLTPSEIMRTLPPLITEQERACGQQRTAKEAEQERQWKHLQQLRQQQTQHQQQIIHDQRMQVIPAMRCIRSEGVETLTNVVGAVGGVEGGALRGPFPRAGGPAYSSDDINRQLRDLLQRHPEKLHNAGEVSSAVAAPSQFRHPLPVSRPRPPLMPIHHEHHQMLMQQRLVSPEQRMMSNTVSQQQVIDQKPNIINTQQPNSGVRQPVPNVSSGVEDSNPQEQGHDEMDIGDMDKLEQDGNMAEVGEILPNLGGEDDDELLESLTAEMGEEFNLLEFADPELAVLNDGENILDGLELADDGVNDRHAKREPEEETDQKPGTKQPSDLQKPSKNIEMTKEVKNEPGELQDVKPDIGGGMAMYGDNIQRGTPSQINIQSNVEIKSEVKSEVGGAGGWPTRGVFSQLVHRPLQGHHHQILHQGGVVQQMSGGQMIGQQQVVQRPQQFQHGQHTMSFQQNPGQNPVNTAQIMAAMTAHVQQAIAAGRTVTPGKTLVGADGAVGVVQHDRTVQLQNLPITPGTGRAAPPPPYPGSRPPPPPPYPHQVPYELDVWPEWPHRRPLLLQNVNQEQPLLLEELLEQEKREQERDEWGGGAPAALAARVVAASSGVAAGGVAAGSGVALYGGVAPPAPPPPPDRPVSDADHHARLLYERWLKQYNAFAADQLRYYETEVQKLRKIRKSLNSKLRQLKKSGNELAPNDAAELARVSNEQQALQKHLEAARKQSKQHNMLMQEYETKQRQNNPQLVQQQQVTNPQNPQIFAQNQNMSSQIQQTITRPMQVGQQTLIRSAGVVGGGAGGAGRLVGRVVVGRGGGRPSMSPLHVQSHSPLHHLTSPLQSPLHPQHSPMHQSPMHSQHSPMHSQHSPMHSQQSPMHSQQSPMHVQTNLPQQSSLHPQQSPLHHQSPLQQSPLHQPPLHQHQMQNQQSPLHQQQQMQGQQMQNQQQLQSQQVQQSQMQSQQMQGQQGQNQQLQNQLQSQQMQNQQLQSQQMQSQQLQNQQMQSQQMQSQQLQNQQMQSSQVQNQQSPLHHQQQMQNQQQMQQQRLQSQSPLHLPQSPLHSPMHMQQSPMHSQQSPMHAQQSPMHAQQSPMHTQQSPMHAQQSPMHAQQSPMHSQQSPMHTQQSPMHAQQSPLPPSMSPQHFLQQLQAQRTSPQLPTPSRSPQIYQQSQIQSPVSSHSPQLQNVEYNNRFSRPAPGCSPLPTRFARPPIQQGMRVAFANRQQTSPLGSPQPMPSPGNNEINRGGNIGGGGGGGGGGGVAPFPPGWRYVKGGLRGGGGGWEEGRRPPSILKRRRTDRIATNEDFEELIDGEETPTRTETATKTVAVISLAAPLAAHTHQYRVGVREPPARASVSIANQTISVPVLKSLHTHKRLNAPPLGSVISVISNPHTAPVIAITTPGTSTSQPRPVSILTHHQIKQKIVKTIEKPLPLSLATTKLSSMTVTHDATLPANIFQDDVASPDSTYTTESGIDHDILLPEKPSTSQLDNSNDSKKEIDIESEISQQTELPHALCLTDRTPLLLGKSDIKSPDPIPEKIPDNIMEGDDEDKSEDEPQEEATDLIKQEPSISTADTAKDDETMKTTIKAIAQTKEMVIGSNMQISGDVPQESVQISIPSPTPSQERYLDDITMREHAEVAGTSAKHSEAFEDMLCILENITPTTTASQTPVVTTAPAQLSPLSQPAELTSNMANVSQQLRTIMSSINTSNAPIEPEPTSTQVNFENLLPSSKVEVPAPRPSPVRIDKPVPSVSSELQVGAAQVIGSRVNTLSSMTLSRKSPTTLSPISSPVNVSTVTKSPAQSPLVTSQPFPSEESNPTTVQSQIIQMPALSKIHNTGAATAVMQTITTHLSNLQKGQTMTTSILGHTLLQPTRQIATTSLPFSSQGISSSQPPALVMTSRTVLGSKEIPPNVTIRNPNIITTPIQQQPPQVSKSYGAINSIITTSKLLHTQLTSPLKRSKSTDEPKSDVVVGHIQPAKRHSVESVIVKSEPMEVDDANGGDKNAQAGAAQRADEAQNVLLKQLLQTSTASATVPSRPMAIQRQAPALGTIPSLEAQLARPSIPPPLTQDVVEIPKTSPRQVTTQPPQFTPKPVLSQAPPPTSPSIRSTTQCLMDVRKQPSVEMRMSPLPTESPTLKNVPVFTTAPPTQQVEPPQPIKKEIAPPAQSPVHRPYTPGDLKRELIDDSSQQSGASGISTASEQGRLEQPIKEEEPDEPITETPAEAKRRKRRNYQKEKRLRIKREAEGAAIASNGKRPRPKLSRYEEDYDTFIDNLMNQLRILPPMQIQEPALTTNFAVCPLFGSGDLTKLKNKDYDLLKGDLIGEFGNAKIPNVGDYYNTKPFGDEEPLPEKPPASTQRGFYDQEFQPITFDEENAEKKVELMCRERDTDTPDSIVSCSSPECVDVTRFPGLEEAESDGEGAGGRGSPEVRRESSAPLVPAPPPRPAPKDNVTVTLTLTSAAAEDILGVLKELATLLHIPPPTAYQIVERTATPPSHRLGLYRSKGKDGKEAAPVDIQSILNGAAKFCRHCDVVILDSVVRAKASEFPLLTSNKGNADGILCDSDTELCFCSTQCYERFAWRPTNIILDGKCKSSTKEVKSEDMGKEEFDTASPESMETDELDMKPDIKDEKMDLSFMDSLDNDELMKAVGDDVSQCVLDDELKTEEEDSKSGEEPASKYRGVRYKWWSPGCIGPSTRYKRPTDRELAELVFRTGVAIMPVSDVDVRRCELCGIQGDGVADGVSRLLNCDVDRWVHLNCALWSEGVYETVSGALINVDTALANGANATCAVCRRLGATVRCFKVRCGSVYHVGCAVKDNCVFYKNKSAFCASHAPKGEKDNELTTLSVQRRVYVSRDEQRQVASVMLHSDSNHLIRVGGLIFLSPGHLLPHQLATFHTPNYIYPIGYKIVRFYWSCVRANSRARYVCWISELEGKPRFHVRAQDHTAVEHQAPTARAAWEKILESVAILREQRTEEGVLKLWPNYVTGEDLFGLTEPAVVRVLESLPGIETLSDYRFKFGRSALLEGGLSVNPAGCARCEPRCRSLWRRAPRPAPSLAPHSLTVDPTPACPYSKQFVHTKSSQYKKMKQEWRNNVYLARSKIQGLGLYAARDLEKHTMVIEYIGEIIRSELSELREKQYEAKNRGIYMFRLDERRVVDATLSGGLARYINHSCQPNCVTETVEVDRQMRIIIFAKRRISRGEELSYDYKFDIEDDQHKIKCMCGAPNCRKWMN